MASVALDEPVSIDAPFQMVRTIAITSGGRYFLWLAFDRRDATFERLRTLVGGAHGQTIEVGGALRDAGEPPGLRIPVWWSLQTQAGLPVAEAQGDVFGANSWSSQEVCRLLYTGDLPAGQYEFKATLAEGVGEFRGIRARFRLEREPKLQ
jgi:hypothetical protein